MYNFGEMIAEVQSQFGDEAEVQITRDDIKRWLNHAQRDIARKTECLQAHATTPSVKDDGSYSAPEDFIKIRRLSYSGRKLEPTRLEDLDDLLADREKITGSPKYFYVWSGNIWLHPKPDKPVEPINIFYVHLPRPLVADVDIPEVPEYMHEDMIRYALARAKEKDEQDDVAVGLMADYEMRLAQSKEDVQENVRDSYPAVRVLPEDW